MLSNYNKTKHGHFFAEDPFKKDVNTFIQNIECYLPQNLDKKIKTSFLQWVSSNIIKNKKYLKKLSRAIETELNNDLFYFSMHKFLKTAESSLPKSLLLLALLPMVTGATDY